MASVASKTARVLQASTSNAAGGTTTGGGVDLTAALGMTITARITDGATGPTVGCSFITEISHDGSAWREFSRQTAGTTANLVTDFVVEAPPSAMHLRCRFSGNTGQAVTVEATGHELTSIG